MKLTVSFTDSEFRRLSAVADECGESPEAFVRSIALATCTPKVEGAREDKATPAWNARSEKGAKPATSEAGGLIVLDESQKPVKCDGCGQETIRAKSPLHPRNYAALYREIDWSAKPPRAKRHMCGGGK